VSTDPGSIHTFLAFQNQSFTCLPGWGPVARRHALHEDARKSRDILTGYDV